MISQVLLKLFTFLTDTAERYTTSIDSFSILLILMLDSILKQCDKLFGQAELKYVLLFTT